MSLGNAARSQAFRDRVEVVALDPSAPYAAAVRRALLLANQALTRVRQRVTRELLDRRSRTVDPVWANRRLLLRAGERLSSRALARMWNGHGQRPHGADPVGLDREGTAAPAAGRRQSDPAGRRDDGAVALDGLDPVTNFGRPQDDQHASGL